MSCVGCEPNPEFESVIRDNVNLTQVHGKNIFSIDTGRGQLHVIADRIYASAGDAIASIIGRDVEQKNVYSAPEGG